MQIEEFSLGLKLEAQVSQREGCENLKYASDCLNSCIIKGKI